MDGLAQNLDIPVPRDCNGSAKCWMVRLSTAAVYALFTSHAFSSVGHPPPEGGAHRGAGGGAEGKRSDHGGEGGGARPGGAGTHSVRETGTVSLLAANTHAACLRRVFTPNQ